MRRILLCTLACLTLAQAETLSQGDRDYTISALHATRKQVIDTLSGLSEAQLKWKPAPDRWSIFEIAEHLALTERLVPQTIAEIMKTPATPEKRLANPRPLDAQLLAALAQRDQKAKAPATLVPAAQFKNLASARQAFIETRDRNIAYVRETPDDLRAHFRAHPSRGELDGLQWFLLLAGHTERHVEQMREVLAAPGFPKN